MAKQISTAEAAPGVFQRIQGFFDDIISELKKVTWPTKEDLMASTKVTLFLLLIMVAIIFVYDRVFGFFIMLILNFAV
jgi:preprotein translocase subunit SecE